MTINSFDYILQTREKTVELISHTDVERLNNLCRAYKVILDLLPEDMNKLFSGHIFPYLESYIELENCLNLLYMGLYKSSLISLRSCFELGLVCIYFDRSNDSEIKIQEWIRSSEDTPFKRTIINGLKDIPNISNFFKKTDLLVRINDLYSELSNYVHTCGTKYSTSTLNGSNITTFNQKSLQMIIGKIEVTVQILTVLFLLKYPIGMHYTPVDEKYGLNTPVGTFVAPDQALCFKRIIPLEYRTELENICLNDKNAIELANWLNEQPDLTDEQWKQQIEEQDKQEIEYFGFEKWEEMDLGTSDSKYKESLKKWAIDNGFYTNNG